MSEENLDDQIRREMENYKEEKDKFEKGTKASAARARKSLSEITRLAKELRKEIQEKKNAM